MTNLNSLIIFGHIAGDARIEKIGENDLTMVTFPLANNYTKRRKDGTYTDALNIFFIRLFGKRAEGLYKYLVKGQALAVSGCLRQNRWIDKDSNKTRSRLEIIAGRVYFCGKRPLGAPRQGEGGERTEDIKNLANIAMETEDADWGESPEEIPFDADPFDEDATFTIDPPAGGEQEGGD